jgi:signal transduction histidine kinase
MRERALELGGSFETLSADASGTRIVAILPISA